MLKIEFRTVKVGNSLALMMTILQNHTRPFFQRASKQAKVLKIPTVATVVLYIIMQHYQLINTNNDTLLDT